MDRRTFASAAAGAALAAIAPVHALAAPPPTWDDLFLVESKRFDAVYLLPGADFRPYSKVMLHPSEVAFQRNWLRDFNARASLSRRITDADAQRIMERVRQGIGDSFARAFRQAGYAVVQAPGPDVLALKVDVHDLTVAAPDLPRGGRTRTFSRHAGGAVLALEARDSLTDALLGRVVDRQAAGDQGFFTARSSATNEADFQRMFDAWARDAVNGLAELKALSGRRPPRPTLR